MCKSLEMINILFSLNFYNLGNSAYSGNRNFVCRIVVLYLEAVSPNMDLWNK
jgi:hypothetical protein